MKADMEQTDSMIIGQVAESNGAASNMPRKLSKSKKIERRESRAFYEDTTGKIKRAYKVFSSTPSPQPMTLCFQCRHLSLDHQQVCRLVRERLNILEDSGGFTIQFIPRVVIHGASSLEDRWLITVQTLAARRELQRGLFYTTYSRSYVMRRYDDVINEEYQKYLRLSLMTTELLSL